MNPPAYRLQTGTSCKTVVYDLDGGFVTVTPPPVCEQCKEPMVALMWMCGGCGEVDG